MGGKRLIIPDEFLVIEYNPVIMPLPGVGIQRFLRHSYYELLIKEAREGRVPFVFAVMQRPESDAFPKSAEGLYRVGVVCSVEAVGAAEPRITVFGRYRAKIGKYEKKVNDLWVATSIEQINDQNEEGFIDGKGAQIIDPQYGALVTGALMGIRTKLERLCQECSEFAGHDDADTQGLISIYDSFYNRDLNRRDVVDQLVWQIMFAVPIIDSHQKQHIIECTSLLERIGQCLMLLEWNIEAISKARMLNEATKSGVIVIKRQRVPINDGRSGRPGNGNAAPSAHPEMAKRWERYQKIKESLNSEANKAILEDFHRIESCRPEQAEWNTFINHLDCLLLLYSTEITPQERDMSKVEGVLGESHYGLEDVKDRIYDYLATKIRNPKGKAPILCFVGPPGVGKTSIGKSIAGSLGLKFVRLSLGGVRDEADIRGHRRTYIGAIPGNIIQEIVRLGVRNPVFMLDEVDKIHNDFRGDPSSALLEVFDPEQNHSFRDHYVGAPFDLSGVLFLCTANVASAIQPALFNRMEPINIAGYTEYEKIQIAKKFLVPKQLVETGLQNVKINWQSNDPDSTLSKIVKEYTREAGVRELERGVHQIFSRWGRQAEKEYGRIPAEITVTEELIEKMLGSPKYSQERVKPTGVGEAVGLAWTPVGGDILYIQVALVPFTGKELSLTGSQGRVMQEACKVAVSLIRLYAEKRKKSKILENRTVHIHVPEGSVEKDGPSAGITTFCALYSGVFGLQARPLVAMTGEINLQSMVTKVGGIKEKVLAAHRDGVREVVLPSSNEQDVRDKIPEEIKKKLKFHFVSRIEEVLSIVFQQPQ